MSTQHRQRLFLEAVATTGEVLEAVKIAGIAPRTPYDWISRSEAFRERFATAKRAGEQVLLDRLLRELWRRVFKQRKPSDLLLMFSIKRYDPLFRDSAQVHIETQGPVAIAFGVDKPAIPDVVERPAIGR